jgi:ABC-2 type transport system permease protein
MQLNRVMAIVLRQYYLLRRSLTRLIPLFVWAAIDIVLWGFITRFLNNITSESHNFVPMFLGAVLLWDFLVRVMQGTSMPFMEDAWSRNFLNFFATPLTIGEYACGLIITSIATSALGLTVMILLAGIVFKLSFLTYGLMFVPFLIILFLFGIALGIFGCSLLLRLGPAAEWFIWPIPALLSPFACVFYPLTILPHWMQVISYLLPPTYVFESMRTIVAGGHASQNNMLIGLGLAIAYICLACWTFTRVYHKAVRTGLIARYSAENAS